MALVQISWVRFREVPVQKVLVQILRSGSRRLRCSDLVRHNMLKAMTADCVQCLHGSFAMNCQAVGDSA